MEYAVHAARAAWLLATCAIILASDLPVVGLRYLRQVTLYGKLSSMRDKAPLFLDSFALPSRLVWTSYYATGVVLNAACLWAGTSWAAALLQVHLLRRLWECLKVTRFSDRHMHPLQAMAGVGFYTLLPPSLLLEHWARAGTEQGARPLSWRRDLHPPIPCMVFGILGFAVSSIAQHVAHSHLASLKRGADGRDYQLPRHWLFTHVSSSPHYTFEVLLYASLIFVDGGSPSAWLALCFVASNLTVSALRTHQWYNTRFGAAFKAPRAIFPGI
uniref:3-oxo-5-alpha-steroid 4-dehydrogenase C-terminal domain-containing protein n=1 Tax=Hemiselmis andersenii TaxID=464988 RepID=A0A6U5A3U2_HEMAN|mmetsp:Transcript_23277/g.54072  ORF Transcript_23277/g.54072 Transcript_23277/m.54072 type:complete len:272 (+) Transcript_23277:86-901(+)